MALWRGWVPSVIGVVPYVGLNFAVSASPCLPGCLTCLALGRVRCDLTCLKLGFPSASAESPAFFSLPPAPLFPAGFFHPCS